MQRTTLWLREAEINWFRRINGKRIGLYRRITHLGGAVCTIGFVLAMMVMAQGTMRRAAIISACALALSHIPVALIKKLYPRTRPHLALPDTATVDKPLMDASFPSGHSTAIFSVTVPLVLTVPLLGILLIPLALSVSFSRIVLGLHYPSDCAAGAILGTLTGLSAFILSF